MILGHANSKAVKRSYSPEANNMLCWTRSNAMFKAKLPVNLDQPRIWQKHMDFWEPPSTDGAREAKNIVTKPQTRFGQTKPV